MTERLVERLLPYLLARASHIVSAQFYERLKRSGVSVRRWRLLALLWDADGLTINELSAAILIEQSSATRLVERAVRDGLVRKARDTQDGRKTIVSITDRGRDVVRDLIDDAVRVDDAIARAFDVDEAERLKGVLLDLIRRFDTPQSSEGAGSNPAPSLVPSKSRA